MSKFGNAQAFFKRLSSPGYDKAFVKLNKKYPGCGFCGIEKVTRYIVNVDHDYTNNHWENFALACDFCAYVQLLDIAFLYDMPKQSIIYLPNKSQIELNLLYHQWQQMIVEKDSLFEIREALSELSGLVQQVDEFIAMKATYQDHLGFFLKPYPSAQSLSHKLRWVPSFELLQDFSLQSLIVQV